MNAKPESLWTVPNITAQPSSKLYNWRAFEVLRPAKDENFDVHLVGQLVNDQGGRVSSAIKSIDRTTRRVVTNSGRVYELVGAPGYSDDAEYVWESWQRIQGATVVRDVSVAFEADLQVER